MGPVAVVVMQPAAVLALRACIQRLSRPAHERCAMTSYGGFKVSWHSSSGTHYCHHRGFGKGTFNPYSFTPSAIHHTERCTVSVICLSKLFKRRTIPTPNQFNTASGIATHEALIMLRSRVQGLWPPENPTHECTLVSGSVGLHTGSRGGTAFQAGTAQTLKTLSHPMMCMCPYPKSQYRPHPTGFYRRQIPGMVAWGCRCCHLRSGRAGRPSTRRRQRLWITGRQGWLHLLSSWSRTWCCWASLPSRTSCR